MSKHNFKKMKIWLRAMELCDEIFKITEEFPKVKIYSVTSLINRSVISALLNIGEGSSRNSNRKFKRFPEISPGSLYELQTQIVLSGYKNYISKNN